MNGSRVRFSRKELLERYNAKISEKKPIIFGGAGIGLVAKVMDAHGIDGIMAYSTGPFRMDGHPSPTGYLAYGDTNTISLDVTRKVSMVVKNAPIIAGISAQDPYRFVDELIDDMLAGGASGVTNVTTCGGVDGKWRLQQEESGIGYNEEVKMVKRCRERDILTCVYAFDDAQIRAMTEAGADIIAIHFGLTTGGDVGADSVPSLERACEEAQRMLEIVKSINPECIVFAHGGPLDYPQNVQRCFETTDVKGFVGASSLERFGVEIGVAQLLKEFQGLKMR